MGAQPLRVALLGAGAVGSQVARLLQSQAGELAARVGAPFELVGIGVQRPDVARPGLDKQLVTTDIAGLVARPDVDIVIELMGGIEPARTALLSAMSRGASVVTGNKALLATHGAELHEMADRCGVDLYYEASVAGAIPLLRPLRESLAGDNVSRVLGIVNGTTNYILTKMDETGASFDEALAEAQALGYAEADPTADVDGHDAAAKAAILAGLAFHTRVTLDDVHCEGIRAVTSGDVAAARSMDHVVKLLAICERTVDGRGVSVRVHPAMVSRAHPLAGVREAYNAVFVESESAGQLMFYGRGAGGAPTASAVLGDLVAVGPQPAVAVAADRARAPTRTSRCGPSVPRRNPLLHLARRRGQGGCPRRCRADLRPPRRVDRDPAAGRPRGRRRPRDRHPPRHRIGLGRVVEELRGLDVVRKVASVLRVEGD